MLSERYVLHERIASGGMGEVWRGTDPVLQRTVAVKVLLPALIEDAEFISRFRIEARMMAALRHPGIVQVYDYGADALLDGIRRDYLVMEHVEGMPLSKRIKTAGKFGIPETLAVVVQAAEALHVAHEAGIVHRDVKPSNLLVRPDGTIVLIDFGVARSVDVTGVTTTTNMLVGSPQYMAPEQVTAQPLSGATDIYALGAVAYCCLTGRPPFTGDSPVQVIGQLLHGDAPTLPSQLPPPVAELVLRALDKDPANRFPTAAAFAEAARAASTSAAYSMPAAYPPPPADRRPTESRAEPQNGQPAVPPAPAAPPAPAFGSPSPPAWPNQEAATPLSAGGPPAWSQNRPAAAAPARLTAGPPLTPFATRDKQWLNAVLVSAVAVAVGVAILVAAVLARPGTSESASQSKPNSQLSAAAAFSAGADVQTAPQANSTLVRPTGAAPLGTGKPQPGQSPQLAPPANQANPANPANPASSANPASPASPGDSAAPVQSAQPATPAPAPSTKPTTSAPKPKPTPTAAKATSATSATNPYTAAQACGSGYAVIDSASLTKSGKVLATVYLLYNASNANNCTVTLKRTSVGTATTVTAHLQVQGKTTATDSGSFKYYAGPVRAKAAAVCVKWGGSTGGVSYTSPFEHCG